MTPQQNSHVIKQTHVCGSKHVEPTQAQAKLGYFCAYIQSQVRLCSPNKTMPDKSIVISMKASHLSLLHQNLNNTHLVKLLSRPAQFVLFCSVLVSVLSPSSALLRGRKLVCTSMARVVGQLVSLCYYMQYAGPLNPLRLARGPLS